jgi:HSP20 family protein
MENKPLPLKDKREHGARAELTQGGPVFVPAVDILEDGDQLILIADMPGVDASGIDIRIENNELHIHGRVSRTTPGEYLVSEYPIGDFMRSFVLSNLVDASLVSASIKNGVLRVTLPKSQAAKPRKIQVHSK